MKIADFRACPLRQLLPLWTAYEKEVRERDPKLWLPKDLERRLQWSLQDSRADPYAIGKAAVEEEAARGFMLAHKRRLSEFDIMHSIYPPSFAYCSIMALDLKSDYQEALRQTWEALIPSADFESVENYYCLTPLAAHETVQALKGLGFEEWIMLAERPAVSFEAPSFEGIVRPAAPEDQPSVVSLWVEMIKYHHSVDPRSQTDTDLNALYTREFKQASADRDQKVFVAELNGVIIGEIQCMLNSMESDERISYVKPGIYGYVGSAAVSRHFRHHGAGKALFAAANEWFLSRRVSSVQLHYNTGNPISPTFWRGLGFEPFIVTLHLKRNVT